MTMIKGALWNRHSDSNNFTLEHRHFELAGYRGRKYDGYVLDIYGWIDQTWDGKFRAGHPVSYDEETDSDAVDLGIFDDVEVAKKAVEEANPPGLGGIFI